MLQFIQPKLLVCIVHMNGFYFMHILCIYTIQQTDIILYSLKVLAYMEKVYIYVLHEYMHVIQQSSIIAAAKEHLL